MSRKRSGTFTNNSYNVTHINGRKRYINKTSSITYIDNNGNKSTLTNTYNTDIDRRNSFIFKLFKISLVLIFGAMFFSNGVNGFNNSKLQATTKTEYISNNINGTNYEYRLHYSDYDYTEKINQLGSLRNVFDLNALNEVYYGVNAEYPYTLKLSDLNSPIYHYPYGDYYSKYVVHYEQFGNPQLCTIGRVSKVDSQTELTFAIDYLEPTEYFVLNMFTDSTCQDFYYNFYTHFANATNSLSVLDREIEKYKVENNLNEKEWYDDIVYAFKIMNAPIIWASNLFYDLGVILNFIVNW